MMKHIGRFILTVAAAAITVSCVEDIAEDPTTDKTPSDEPVEMTFKASFADTKTTLVNGVEVWWEPGDVISINGESFRSTNTKNCQETEFIGSLELAEEYYAIYPQQLVEYWDKTEKSARVYVNGSISKDGFQSGENISAAKSNNQTLYLKNLLGYVKFSLIEESWDIRQIEIYSNANEPLCGYCDLKWTNDEPKLIPGDESTTSPIISLTAEGAFEKGDYYISMIPGTYKSGLTIKFTSVNNQVAFKSIDKEITLKNGYIQNIGDINELKDQHELERQALIAFYNATGGDNWINNDNWCSDKSINEWFGVYLNSEGFVDQLYFLANNLSGNIPDEIANLRQLRSLFLSYEDIYGEIPDQLYSLTELEDLVLIGNIGCQGLTGAISEKICNLQNLYRLSISSHNLTGELPSFIVKLRHLTTLNLSDNRLSGNIPDIWEEMTDLEYLHLGGNTFKGTIPDSMGALKKLSYLSLEGNGLSGKVPSSVFELPIWPECWLYGIIRQNPEIGGGISREGLKIPVPKARVKTIDGEYIDGTYFSENEYTVIFGYLENCPFSDLFIPELVNLYNKYKDKGLEIISVSQQSAMSESVMRGYIERFGMDWRHHIIVGTEDNPLAGYDPYVVASPTVAVADKSGYLQFIPEFDNRDDLDEFLAEKLGDVDEDDSIYESTDYSADGEVHIIQKAKDGNGINVVLMGDAFSDRLIADGTYAEYMSKAYEALFSIEPYKSFSELFNVYYVDVVSKNEAYYVQDYSTALETHLGAFEGGGLTSVWGNDAKVFGYASKAVSDESMNEALVIVLMNANTYAGQCYLYDPVSGDYGSGASVSYFPLGTSDELLEQLLHHEALGHGFAKLADEYYSGSERVTDLFSEGIISSQSSGYFKNVDFTDSRSDVRWAHLLSDERYKGEDLGIFEGAFNHYAYGIYRPSYTSIMVDNTGGFNAPSREAIYYRIHKLAYGPEWEYKYEDFVEYDAINRKSAAQAQTAQKRRSNYVEKPFEPTHPPVIVKGSWRDAVK